jgi:hypothetical protein
MRRMRVKTPDPRVPPPALPLPPGNEAPAALPLAVDWKAQWPVRPPPVLSDAEHTMTKRSVYLVTFSHPRSERSADGVPLVAPETLEKQAILGLLLAACAEPDYDHSHKDAARKSCVALNTAGVWKEAHEVDEDGEVHFHYHVALRADAQFSFAPVKRALLRRCGLASHWSCSHDGYWSCARYCSMPSPEKPASSLDCAPLLWARSGAHPPLRECIHEPATARARRSKREREEMHAAEAGRKEPRINDIDLWPIVVAANIRDTPDNQTAALQLMAYVKAHGSKTVQEFVFKNRARLTALIADCWSWEEAETTLAAAGQTRLGALHAAAGSPCVCGGDWGRFLETSLHANGIDVRHLCRAVLASLENGRGPRTPVIVLAGARGGEAKSVFLKGLASVYRPTDIFHAPQPGSFPLMGLPTAKVAILDDFRFDQSVLAYQTMCLWFDGSPLPISRPQNQAGVTGHTVYEGTAPIFLSTKLQDMQRMAAAAASTPFGPEPVDGEASMILRRLEVYVYRVRVTPPGKHIPTCPCCFARFILSRARLEEP